MLNVVNREIFHFESLLVILEYNISIQKSKLNHSLIFRKCKLNYINLTLKSNDPKNIKNRKNKPNGNI